MRGPLNLAILFTLLGVAAGCGAPDPGVQRPAPSPAATQAAGITTTAPRQAASATPTAGAAQQFAIGGEATPFVPESVPDLGLEGRVLFTQGMNGLWEVDLSSGDLQQLVHLPDGGWVNGVASAPNDARLALAYSATSTTFYFDDLALAEPDGSGIALLQERSMDYEYFGTPVFHPVNGYLYYTHLWSQMDSSGEFEDVHLAIERIRPRVGASPEQVIPDALQPSFSADGEWMSYIHSGESGFERSIWHARSDGSEARELVPASDFIFLFGAQLSPDGSRLVFAGSGENFAPQDSLSFLEILTSARPAHAHGLPWDLWSVDLASEEMSRLTELNLDSPWPVWSPDGSLILVLSGSGLGLLGPGGQLTPLASAYGHGEAVWVDAP